VGLASYILRRILQLVPVALAIVVINFTLVHLAPGDPAQVLAGEYATPEYVARLHELYGLDQPLPVQLGKYLRAIVHGDLGQSFSYRQPVLDIILSRVPATLLLILTSQILGLIIGTALGTISARFYPSRVDSGLSFLSLAGYSMPIFWLGLIFIYLFAIKLRWLPTSGMRDVTSTAEGFAATGDVARHLILPVLSLLISWTIPTYLRIARASVIEVSREDFITTARCKGLDEKTVFFKHALRNALLPTVTMAGLYLGLALTGAVLTETVFGWPGVGRLMYEAIFSRDYPLLMGIFVLSALAVVVVSLVTDIVNAFLDPRVVYE
jgi:peptide/nickel transport system permease protein